MNSTGFPSSPCGSPSKRGPSTPFSPSSPQKNQPRKRIRSGAFCRILNKDEKEPAYYPYRVIRPKLKELMRKSGSDEVPYNPDPYPGAPMHVAKYVVSIQLDEERQKAMITYIRTILNGDIMLNFREIVTRFDRTVMPYLDPEASENQQKAEIWVALCREFPRCDDLLECVNEGEFVTKPCKQCFHDTQAYGRLL